MKKKIKRALGICALIGIGIVAATALFKTDHKEEYLSNNVKINGFTVSNWKKKAAFIPGDDSFSIDSANKILAVADGVTRDPQEIVDLGTLKGKLEFAWYYPRPSPAKKAADIFCQTFSEVLRGYNQSSRDEKAIKKAYQEANSRIKQWNNQNMLNMDYILNDFAGCVSSGVIEKEGVIYFGCLADCGVAIFDENGNLRFRTENQGPGKYDKYIWQDKRLQNIDWKNPEAREIIRKYYRNNPSEKNSYGVLTGEDAAMDYVRTGKQEIKPNEHLFVYTDGLEQAIFSNEFGNKLKEKDMKKLEKLCRQKVETEGTLIYYTIK